MAALGGDDPHVPKWVTTTLGTHTTVVVWYSPDVYRWMCERDAAHERRFVTECRKTCPTCKLALGQAVRPIEDGSMILKMMYGNTTEQHLEDPSIPKVDPNIIALMVRDSRGGKDGWYWGSWDPQATEASQIDWPPPANLPYPWMGFGYYCVNCHASAKDEFTFSSLNNVIGDPDTFVKFYFQDQPPIVGEPPQPVIETISAHERFEPLQDLLASPGSTRLAWNKVPWPNPVVNRLSAPLPDYSPEFLKTFGAHIIVPPTPQQIVKLFMAPEVYDHVFPGRRRAAALHDLGPVRRLPRRGLDRPALRHDAPADGARRVQRSPQPRLLRRMARLADGARRARSDLLLPARDRAEDPPRARQAGAGRLPPLPRGDGAAAVLPRSVQERS